MKRAIPGHLAVKLLDAKPLLEAMGRLNQEIGRINLQLSIRSPARAGLKTLTEQTREVATILTGDPGYFDGKAHSFPQTGKTRANDAVRIS